MTDDVSRRVVKIMEKILDARKLNIVCRSDARLKSQIVCLRVQSFRHDLDLQKNTKKVSMIEKLFQTSPSKKIRLKTVRDQEGRRRRSSSQYYA